MVGAEAAEGRGRELEPESRAEVAGVEDQAGPERQVTEAGAVEDRGAVEPGRDLGAVIGREGQAEPVQGVGEEPHRDLQLEVPVQHAVHDLVEAATGRLPGQVGIEGRREGAARHRGDVVDLAQERARLPVLPGHGDRLQRRHRPVGQGRRPRPAAGEREEHRHLPRVVGRRRGAGLLEPGIVADVEPAGSREERRHKPDEPAHPRRGPRGARHHAAVNLLTGAFSGRHATTYTWRLSGSTVRSRQVTARR